MVHLNAFLAVEKDSKARMMCRFVHCFFFLRPRFSLLWLEHKRLIEEKTPNKFQQYMWRKYNCFCTDQTLKLFLVSFKPWLKIKREPWGKVEYWLLIINLRLHRIGTKYKKKYLNLKRESSTLNISGNSCNFFFS